MAAKKQLKGAPPIPAVKAVPVKKLTRKEKHVINAANYRKAQADIIAAKKVAIEIRHKQGRPKGTGDRPTIYNEDLGCKICLMFATDVDAKLMDVQKDTSLPTVYTVYEWLRTVPSFARSYARARELQADLQAEELRDLARKPLIGEITVKRSGGKDGNTTEVRTHDNVERARLIVDTDKWLLSKLRPKKYGVQPLEAEDGNDALQELLNQFRSRSQAIENAS